MALNPLSFWGYWYGILRAAILDCVSGLGYAHWRQMLIALMLISLTFGLYWQASEPDVFEEAAWLLASAKAFIFTLGVLLLVGFIRAPWMLHRDTEKARAALALRRLPRLAFCDFDPECDGCLSRHNAGFHDLMFDVVQLAVRNTSDVPIKNAVIYITKIDGKKTRRPLTWPGVSAGKAKLLNPSSEHYHVSFMRRDEGHDPELVDVGNFATGFEMGLTPGTHVFEVSAEAARTTPAVAEVTFTVGSKTAPLAITIRRLTPDYPA